MLGHIQKIQTKNSHHTSRLDSVKHNMCSRQIHMCYRNPLPPDELSQTHAFSLTNSASPLTVMLDSGPNLLNGN